MSKSTFKKDIFEIEKTVEKLAKNRYSYLFLSILLLLALMPIVENWHPIFIPLLFLMLIMAILYNLNASKRLSRFLLILGLLSFLFSLIARTVPQIQEKNFYLLLFGVIINALFILVSIKILVARIFSEKIITSDTIQGGISVYFLMAFLWAFFYDILLLFDPNAISLPGTGINHSEIIYFSFTTLTTLGYGDISPVSHMARNLTILESTLGPLYLAVLISRLVSKHVSGVK